MNIDEYWQIIECARSQSNSSYKIGNSLSAILSKRTPKENIEFYAHTQNLLAATHRWDLWGIGFILNGGCSDDGFLYFRCWMITHGRENFESALKNPTTIGDLAEIEYGSSNSSNFPHFEYEELMYIPVDTYENMTGKEFPYDYEKLIDIHAVEWPVEPIGTPWKENNLDKLHPELHIRFQNLQKEAIKHSNQS